ncbi:MAG: hypothetical protein GX661_07145 [Acholeplasmataceae bacterium]|nr:hypothetical protein [Acholeplasmataceae bacterium]
MITNISIDTINSLTISELDALRFIENNRKQVLSFSSLDYVNLFTKKELLEKFSMDERGPEFLLTAKPYKHFYHRDYPYGTYGASHDSFDDTSQHIFGILFGAGVNKLHNYYNRVDSIDLIPTIVRKVHGVTLKDATGKINEDFFVNNNDLSCS